MLMSLKKVQKRGEAGGLWVDNKDISMNDH